MIRCCLQLSLPKVVNNWDAGHCWYWDLSSNECEDDTLMWGGVRSCVGYEDRLCGMFRVRATCGISTAIVDD